MHINEASSDEARAVAFVGFSPWFARRGVDFPGVLYPFGAAVAYKPYPTPEEKRYRYEPDSVDGIFLGYHLHCGGEWSKDYFVCTLADFAEDAISDGRRTTVLRVREVIFSTDGQWEFPIAEAKAVALKKRLIDQQAKGVVLHDVNGGGTDDVTVENDDVESIPDMFDLEYLDDSGPQTPEIPDIAQPTEPRAPAAGQASSSSKPSKLSCDEPQHEIWPLRRPGVQRPLDIPPGMWWTFTVKERREFLEARARAAPTAVAGRADIASAESCSEEEEGRPVRTVVLKSLLRRAGCVASGGLSDHGRLSGTRQVRFDPCEDQGGSHVFGGSLGAVGAHIARQPLLEFCCDDDSELGEVGRACGREVLRLTYKSDMTQACNVKSAADYAKCHPGAHLHGALPCTGWTSWTEMNLFLAALHSEDRLARQQDRLNELRGTSVKLLEAFVVIALIVLGAGGSVSFEWPRHCSGWNKDFVVKFLLLLGLTLVDVDGCAVGSCTGDRKHLLYKPWRFAVSSPSLFDVLVPLRCSRDHLHSPVSGSDTKQSGHYPRALAEAIHRGLDTHERERAEVLPAMIAVDDVDVSGVALPAGISIDALGGIRCDGVESPLDERAHREKSRSPEPPLFNTMITRLIPAKSAEFRSPPCQAAIDKEVSRLRAATVWDESSVREWNDVRKDPEQVDAFVARLFVIMGQKNSEMFGTASEMPFKARAVVAGNNLQSKTGVPAYELFSEVSSAPATMSAARGGCAVAAMRGWEMSLRDAEQAYIQASLVRKGKPLTWVRLPRTWWPKSWADRFRDPVVLLLKALYGHPESGAVWEGHLRKALTGLGWGEIESWPSVWLLRDENALLIVYVDDLLLIAAQASLKKIWQAIESKVRFGEEAQPLRRYLGVHHHVVQTGAVTEIVVDQAQFLIEATKTYATEIGVSTLPFRATPYHLTSGDAPPDDIATRGVEPDVPAGKQAGSCASHLMRLLYAARQTRPDLTTAITRLTSSITRWNQLHDVELHQLMCYAAHHARDTMHFVLSRNDLLTVKVQLWVDSDWAGDKSHSKSTSGYFLELAGEDGRYWPITWGSKKQGSTASCSAEAEFICLATSLKKEAIPFLIFIEAALGRQVELVCLEDNAQVLTAARKGYSPALRHVSRTERVSTGVVHEVFYENPLVKASLVKVSTDDQKADMFTKKLENAKFHIGKAFLGLRHVPLALK